MGAPPRTQYQSPSAQAGTAAFEVEPCGQNCRRAILGEIPWNLIGSDERMLCGGSGVDDAAAPGGESADDLAEPVA